MCDTCKRLAEEQAMEKRLTGADITEAVEALARRFNEIPGVESWLKSEGSNGHKGRLGYTFTLSVRVEPPPAPEAPKVSSVPAAGGTGSISTGPLAFDVATSAGTMKVVGTWSLGAGQVGE
jgi:hypothetical protein